MKELEIISKEDYEYELQDMDENEYNLNIEFLDIDNKPEIGDYIYMSDELLDTKYEGYSRNYTFGNLNNKYGKPNIEKTDIDVIKLVVKNKEIYLKRLYG